MDCGFENYWKVRHCGTFWKVEESRLSWIESGRVPTEKKVNKDDIAEFELKVRCQKLRVGERTEGMSSQIGERLH